MSKRINSISMIQLLSYVILLTYILGAPVQPAAGRGTPGSTPRITRSTNAAPEISLLRGGIGMGTWDTKTEFRDILVQTGEKALLRPDFTSSLNGWQKVGGEWSATGGVLSQNSRAINCLIICGDNKWTNYTYSLKARRTEGTEGFLIVFAVQDSKNLYWWNIGGWGNTRTAIEKMTSGAKREIPGTAVNLSIETGTWYDIKISINDNIADCYFNGNLITRVTQDKGSSTLPDAGPPMVVNNGNGPEPARSTSTLRSGRIGISRSLPVKSDGPAPTPDEVINKVLIPAAPVLSPETENRTGSALRGGIGMGTWGTKAEFKDILVQNSDKTLLRPYFTNGIDGWQKAGGDWTGASGVLTQNSRNTNCQIICAENTWTNYTYSLKARRTEGTEGLLIIFAAQDGKNLYCWNIGGWGNTRTAIEKMSRGSKREIPGTAVNLRIETGTWYDIKIALHGDTADCYFNGKLITTITRDKGTSTMPDAGAPLAGNNANGTEPAGTADLGGSMQVTTVTSENSQTSLAPKMDNPASWVPIANGCQIQQTGTKIQITGTSNIDGWGHGNGVISTSVIPAGDFYATVNFIVRRFSGPGNARVYFRAVSTKDNGKMAAIMYDPKNDTFQVQGWNVNGEPNTITQPIQKAGNNMMYRWLTLQYDSKN